VLASIYRLGTMFAVAELCDKSLTYITVEQYSSSNSLPSRYHQTSELKLPTFVIYTMKLLFGVVAVIIEEY
jgi:hypothetical protein